MPYRVPAQLWKCTRCDVVRSVASDELCAMQHELENAARRHAELTALLRAEQSQRPRTALALGALCLSSAWIFFFATVLVHVLR